MKKNYLVGYKLFFALLGFSAIVTEIATLVATGIFNPANFFSFFTIEANIIAATVFLISAFATYAGKKSAKLDFMRGASTFFMIVTGIVFAVLLAGIENAQLTAVPWDNTVLHYLIPIAVAIDWIMDPPARRFAFRQGLAWIIFPILYLIYSLFRGPIANWYPYPFLNPANGGYNQILITSLIITAGGLVLIYIVTRFGRATRKK
ncbi:MAG: Pr6Pr family membrane protein [Candidatus Microsaccharimonas sp.]